MRRVLLALLALGAGLLVPVPAVEAAGVGHSGTVRLTIHLADGTTDVLDFAATCVPGAAGVCPFVGTVIDGPDPQNIEHTPMAPSLNLLGPVTDAPYTEIAMHSVKRCSYGLLFNAERLSCDFSVT